MPPRSSAPGFKPACARITAGELRGTGFLVSAQRLLTCNHVIRDTGGAPILVTFPHGQYEAVVELVDVHNDCALLLLTQPVPTTDAQPLPIAAEPVGKSAGWEGYGFPAAAGMAGLLIDGRVQDPTGQDPALRTAVVLQSANVTAGGLLDGFSGSPVLVEGKVIGQMRSIIPDQTHGAQLAVIYACPADLLAELARARLGGEALQAASPYRGLSAFQVEDSPLFFGREALTAKLWTRFKALYDAPQAPWFLAILGPSGSGKSSVAHAGLLAALGQRPVPGPGVARTVALKPGEHPVRALALALSTSTGTGERGPDLATQRKLIEDLSQASSSGEFDGLSLWAANFSHSAAAPLVLLVDQFEEVYTLCRDRQKRDAFVGLLLHAASDPARPVAVIITLRSDFLRETHRQHPELNRLLAEQLVVVPAMNREELRQVIFEPASRAGLPIEASTAELLLAESWGSDGALPLLEFALTRVWEGLRLGRPAGVTLREIGGVGGALASRAQEIYSALGPPEQATARRALVRLVQLGEGTRDTRRRVPIHELCGRGESEADVLTVLRKFATASSRLVTLSTSDAETVAEVTHEALFDHWKELRAWINEGRADHRFHARVAAAARLWNEDRSRSGRLWRPPDLDLLRDFWARKPDELSLLDEEFLAAADNAQRAELMEKEQRDRLLHNRARLLRIGLGVVASLLLIAVVIAAYALQAQREARAERDHAEQRELDMVVENGRQLLVEKDRPLEALLRLQSAYERRSRSPILAYLLAAAARQLDAVHLILQGHQGTVGGASYSPDGRRIVTGSWDHSARVWDAQTGQLVTPLHGHSGYVISVRYSPDGSRIVTGSRDSTARVWDAQTGQPITTLQGHTAPVESASYSPDGRRILTGSADHTARIWDAQTGHTITTLQGHADSIESASYSPDGRHIVTGSRDQTARIWDAQTGHTITTLRGHSGSVESASYSPDGRRIITGSWDHTARLWDSRSGQLLTTLQGHADSVESASYSPDGRHIVTGSWDHTARIWDADSGQLTTSLQGHSGSVESVSYSPDGSRIVTGSWDHTARIWDAQVGPLLTTLHGHTDSVASANYSPDGRRITTGSGDGAAAVWDAQSGQLLTRLQGHSRFVENASYDPSGRRIVTSSGDRTARVWDAQTGQLVMVLQGHSGTVESASYSPDGLRIVTASKDHTARVWDARNAQLLQTLQGHSDFVYSASYDRGGSRIVTSSRDQTARVWDAQSGQLLATLSGHAASVTGASYSPDGRSIVTSSLDRTARVWDAQSGRLVTTLQGHSGSVYCASYSPDGLRIVTCSLDRTARLWSAQTGQLVTTLQGHSGSVYSASYSADGLRVVTGSDDHTARVWDVAPEPRSPEKLLTLIHCRLAEQLQGDAVVPAALDPQACKRLPPKVASPLQWDERDAPLWGGIYALQAGNRVAARIALAEARQRLGYFQDRQGLARLELAEAALAADDSAPPPVSVLNGVRQIAPKEQPRMWLALANLAHDLLHHPRWALWALDELQTVLPSDAEFVAEALANKLELGLDLGLRDEVLRQAPDALAAQTGNTNRAVVAALAWLAALGQSARKEQQIWAARTFDFYVAIEDGRTPDWSFDSSRDAFLNQPESPARTAALALFDILDENKNQDTTARLGALLGTTARVVGAPGSRSAGERR